MINHLSVLSIILLLAILPTRSAATNSTVPQTGTILVLGDSLASGLYATHEQATYASLIGEFTGMKLARRHAATLPAAGTIWEEVKVWSPEVVILEVGLNDVSSGTMNDPEWRAAYSDLIQRMQGGGARVVACTMFWAGIHANHPNYVRYLHYNEMIRSAAQEQHATLADLWLISDGCEECVSKPGEISYFAPHYAGDNFHPSDRGHELIATTIYNALHGNYYFPNLMR